MGVSLVGLAMAVAMIVAVIVAVVLGARAVNRSRRGSIEAGEYDRTPSAPAAPGQVGSAPAAAAPAAPRTCSCGAPLAVTARFCKKCGSPAS